MSNDNELQHTICAIAATALFLASHVALAAPQRTFVSTSGVDNATCSLASPCRGFAAAVAAVNAGGEVIVLDSGGYGAVTITKSVSIIAPPGVYAGVSVLSGTGIKVAAGASDVVLLRGISINNQGGVEGVFVTGAAKVQIENCTIDGMAYGIDFEPATTAQLVVTDTSVRNSSGVGFYAVASPGGALSSVDVWRTAIKGGAGLGIYAEDIGRIAVADSLIAENGTDGVYLASSALSPANTSASFERTQIVGNGSHGLQAKGFGTVLTMANVSHSVLANNQGNGALAESARGYIRIADTQITGNLLSGVTTSGGGVVASQQNT